MVKSLMGRLLKTVHIIFKAQKIISVSSVIAYKSYPEKFLTFSKENAYHFDRNMKNSSKIFR